MVKSVLHCMKEMFVRQCVVTPSVRIQLPTGLPRHNYISSSGASSKSSWIYMQIFTPQSRKNQ